MSKCIGSIKGSIKSRLKAVGSRIRKGCEAISISLEELAKKSKLSLDYICEIENGERAPSSQALSRISRVLKTSPEVLLTGCEASSCKFEFGAEGKASI